MASTLTPRADSLPAADGSTAPDERPHDPESARTTTDLRLSVLIPVYNEARTLESLIARVQGSGLAWEVVCVDDCSTDGSGAMLDRLLAEGKVQRVVHHPRNRGKGAAIRTALSQASGDVVVVQDADLEYDPADWPALLRPIVEGKADAVFGSRFLGGPHRVLFFWHAVGNRLLTTFSNMLTNLNLTDMETCYKAMRGELARQILPRLTSERFGLEPELTARLAQARARVYEVPISYAGRTYAEGKKINWKDGVAAFWHILSFNTWAR